ncbi:Potassium voltage-gated channel subfamily KQT; possible potassium channel, VIC family [hydrothermal vent metagenome]|uniref:BK channel n=1 Tax=hydrothermal vent metagenome TaxID=652676 RepID=A0A1W1D580_9ZZZZ
MIGRLLIKIAYFLQENKRYQRTKHFFYNLLENNRYRYKKYFDMFMITLIFTSVIILVDEVKHNVNVHLQLFNNYIISIIFFIEYILRFWVYNSVSKIIIEQSKHDVMLSRHFHLRVVLWKIIKSKLQYVFSLSAIIDLLAIVPFFHQLRLLRIFILFRVFKLFRYTRNFQTFISLLATKKFEFFTLLMFSSVIILVSSVLIYVVEANNPKSDINTLFEAFYWSIVTISTVGYGDITPSSDIGRIVAVIVIIAGIAVLAFTTSLVISAFTEKLDDMKEDKIIENLEKAKDIYLICGYENVAAEVAKTLIKEHKVIVLDEDMQRIERARNDNLIALHLDPGSIGSYQKLSVNMDTQVKAVLCLRESDVENVYTTLTVRSLNKDVYILSLLIDATHRRKLLFAGVDELFYPKELVGMIAKEYIGQPVAFEVFHALRSDHTIINIEEIKIPHEISEKFLSISDLEYLKFRIVLLGLYQDKTQTFLFNPQNDMPIAQNDYLIVIGNKVFIKEFEKHLYRKIAI